MTRALVVAAAMALAFAAQIAAEPYGARVTGTPDGAPSAFSWRYTVYNTSTSPDYVIDVLQINSDAETFVRDARGPSGWVPYFDQTQPDCVVTWTSSGPESDLAPGESLTGFIVFYSRQPTFHGWTADFVSLLDPDERRSDSGEVDTSEGGIGLWEPASATGTAVGLMAFCALVRRRLSR